MPPRLLVLAAVLVLVLVAALVPVVVAGEILDVYRAPVVLVPLWSVSHKTYMCKFIGNKYVLVSSGWGHFDAKSIDEIYIDGSKGTVYVYDVETGKLIKTVRGKKTIFFFPGCTAEDVAFYGTNAKFNGVPLWQILGFNDTAVGHFYGMACYDDIGVVGYKYKGIVYVFSISERRVIVEETIGDVRRAKVGVGGDYVFVFVGAVDNPNLIIYVLDKYTHRLVSRIVVPLEDGVGALDLTNVHDVCHSYLAVGGSQGWIYIFNASPLCSLRPPALILKKKVSSNRFYNPFYTVYTYKIVRLIPFKDNARGGVGAVYDVVTGQLYTFTFPAKDYVIAAACVSPDASYVFLGDTLFKVIPVTNTSILEISGSVVSSGRETIPVSKGITLEEFPPIVYIDKVIVKVYKLYLTRQKITLARLAIPDVHHVSYYETHAHFWMEPFHPTPVVTQFKIEIFDLDPRTGTIRLIGKYDVSDGYATAGFIVYIPPKEVMPVSVAETSRIYIYVKNLNVKDVYLEKKSFADVVWRMLALIGAATLLGAEAGIVAGGVIAGPKGAVIGGAVGAFMGLVTTAVVPMVSEYKVGAYVLPLVLVYDSETGKLYALSYVITSEEMKSAFWDTPYADHFKKFLADRLRQLFGRDVEVILDVVVPEGARTDKDFERLIREGKIRYTLRELDFYSLAYRELLLRRMIPLNRTLIAGVALAVGVYTVTTRGYPNVVDNEFRLCVSMKDIKLEVIPLSRVITGPELCRHGFALVTSRVFYEQHGINPYELGFETAGWAVYKNFYCEIRRDPKTGETYAEMWLTFDRPVPVPATSIIITYWNRELLKWGVPLGVIESFRPVPVDAEMEVEFEIHLKLTVPCRCNDELGQCICEYHHASPRMLQIDKFALRSMPAPAIYVERTFEYTWGVVRNIVYINSSYRKVLEPLLRDTEAYREWLRLGNMFDYVAATKLFVNGTWRTYITLVAEKAHKVLWFDPSNGATAIKCKTYRFSYWYKLPPDVAVKIYFNGTRKIGTQPVHISIGVVSNVPQTVEVGWIVQIRRFDYTKHTYVVASEHTGSASISILKPNEKKFVIIDAMPYIQEAINWMRKGYPAYIYVYARVKRASKGDFFEANSMDNATLTVLPTLVLVENRTVGIYVYDIIANKPIANATVEVYRFENESLVLVANTTTNATGWAAVNLTTGYTYLVRASAPGYRDPNAAVLANGSTIRGRMFTLTDIVSVIRYPLVPETIGGLNFTFIVSPPGNWTHPPYPIKLANGTVLWTVAVQVSYMDGAPVEGARVEIYDAQTGKLVTTGMTNGTGFAYFYVRNCTWVNVHVAANISGRVYEWWRNNTHINQTFWLSFTVPRRSPLFRPEVALLSVVVKLHAGKTWYGRTLSHMVVTMLYTNVNQTVTVEYEVWRVNETGHPVELVLKYNKTYVLVEGTNVFWHWVNLSEPGRYVIHARIVEYENDTTLKNNEVWSNIFMLRPFIDVRASVLVVPLVQQAGRNFIIPEDLIKVCVKVEIYTNARKLPVNISLDVLGLGFVKRHVKKMRTVVPVLIPRPLQVHVVWQNFTVRVPWSRNLTVAVLASSPLGDDEPWNNNVTFTLPIDPNVKLISVKVPPAVVEKSRVEIRVRIRNNLAPGENITVWASIEPAPRAGMLYRITAENMTLNVTVLAPENPPVFKLPGIIEIREGVYTRNVTVFVAAPDVLDVDNSYTTTIRVMSTQLAGALAGVAVATLLCAVAFFTVLALVLTARRRRVRRVQTRAPVFA